MTKNLTILEVFIFLCSGCGSKLLMGTDMVGRSNSRVIDPATNQRYVSYTHVTVPYELRLVTLP
ncbi:MAG TPA: hypothetical protein VI895_04090 [Bdellovibrionota bacterium]|nr:hypothetical protein [Bdellovibrionota bacterium]